MLSNSYWANNIASEALCSKLNLNIITIEKFTDVDNMDKLRILSPNFLKTDNCNSYKKYMFLYLYDNHDELITFSYVNKFTVTKNSNLISKVILFQKIIFDFNKNNPFNDLPPLYILFLIYGSYYSTINDKENYMFKKEIMEIIDHAINSLINQNNKAASDYFYAFKKYFPLSKIQKPIIPPIKPTKPVVEPIEPVQPVVEPTLPKKPKASRRKAAVSPGTISELQSEIVPPSGFQVIQPGTESPGIEANTTLQKRIRKPSNTPMRKLKSAPAAQTVILPEQTNIEKQTGGETAVTLSQEQLNKLLMNELMRRTIADNNQEIKKTNINLDPNQLAYYISVDLELYPGTSIEPEEQAKLKCNSKWNSIKKAYSAFIGKPYVIPPLYSLKNKTKTDKNKTDKNTTSNNNTKKNKSEPKVESKVEDKPVN